MANRKVLINLHSTKNQAPAVADVFEGELIVSHPHDNLSATTIWTKNDQTMVPFISCAQTIAIIDSKIQTSEDDVKAATGETHLEVATADTAGAKVWTLSTKDVQSEEEFKAYSASTNAALTALTEAFNGLLDISLTGGSGDDIITVSTASTDVSANTFTVTHKAAHETEGFKKIKTDAYGHIVASSAVTTEDIQALGFKTSAETGEDLAELSGAVIANETHISELSAGTIHDIETLSGNVVEYVKVVSGNIETVINELSAGTIQLSADTHNTIVKLSGDTEAAIAAAIDGLDSEGKVSAAGKYLTGIGIADGKISGITEADLPVLSVESAGTGNVVSQITVADHKITYQTTSVATSTDIQNLSAATIALSAGTIADIETLSGNVVEYVKVVSGNIETVINELSAGTQADIEKLSAGTIADNNTLSADVVTYINTISGYAHGEIVELSGAVQANETDIDNLSAATLDLSAVTLTGVSLNNTPLTVTDHVVSVPVTTSGSGIANATESGSVADALAVKEYVQNTVSSAVEYKGATDDVPTGTPVKGDLWIASSAFTVDGQNVEIGDFIIYDGTQWQVIEKNLDGAITGTLTQDTVTLGDSVNSVKSLTNGAQGTVLTIGTAGTPVWADDPELTVVSAGTGNVLTDITVNDHEITFTKGITAASNADLQALSGAVEDFSGATDAKFIELSAYTKDVDDKVKALSAGTIQLSADTKAAIEQLSGFAHNSMIARDDAVFSSAKTYTDEKVAAEIALLDSSTAVTAGKYITGIAIADGKISGITEESLPANVAITATTGAAVDTPSAVLTGVTADGTDNHNLTFGMSNKVFSAQTSDSALTSESALTAVHANAAAKVDSALTINIIDATGGTATTVFDGSENQTINLTNTDTATTQEGHYVPATAASAFTAPAGSFLSGVSVDDKNHVLEVAYADKINSATTSESADTAAKVAQALTMTDGTETQTYDGSEAKSLTFGTATSISGEKSMTMTEAGVVDVNVIDCGTY